jgi:lysophospholipase L1-like esterase
MAIISGYRPLLKGVLSIFLVVLFFEGCASQVGKVGGEPRFQSAIDAYLKQDEQQPPPKRAILFIGSSIFRQWERLKEQMQPLPVFNRAFGGSQTADILTHMDKIVFPYAPKFIVYYCGSNDVNAGHHAAAIAGRFFEFVDRVKERLPETRFFYVSVIRAPQKQQRWDVVDSVNTIVRTYCSQTPKLAFIDVNPIFFDAESRPRTALYQNDQLHLVEDGYVEMAGVIKPIVEQAWKSEPGR